MTLLLLLERLVLSHRKLPPIPIQLLSPLRLRHLPYALAGCDANLRDKHPFQPASSAWRYCQSALESGHSELPCACYLDRPLLRQLTGSDASREYERSPPFFSKLGSEMYITPPHILEKGSTMQLSCDALQSPFLFTDS